MGQNITVNILTCFLLVIPLLSGFRVVGQSDHFGVELSQNVDIFQQYCGSGSEIICKVGSGSESVINFGSGFESGFKSGSNSSSVSY
jgi:hypothetical protein